MKNTLLFLLLLLISCRDQYPLPPGIEGHWRQLIPQHPPAEYDFYDGLMTKTTFVGNTPVATIQRTYTQRGDTLLIGGDVGDPATRWLLRFIGEGAVVECTTVASDPVALGAHYILERQ